MYPEPKPVEEQEVHLQERPIVALTDNSLPAEQVITEQNNDANENDSPRFIP
jgi:hypothetical protein